MSKWTLYPYSFEEYYAQYVKASEGFKVTPMTKKEIEEILGYGPGGL